MLKAIIFDVGGVLIRTHNREGRAKWATRFGLATPEFENFVFNSPEGRRVQLGQKNHAVHWQWLGDYFKLTATELATMRQDFFAGDGLNEPLVDYIKQLRQTSYRLGILSNFGDEARQLWGEVYGFSQYFDSLTISCEVGLMKPDPRIYHLALQRLEVQSQEALFIDDFMENIIGAQQVGLQTIHFTDTETVLEKLKQSKMNE